MRSRTDPGLSCFPGIRTRLLPSWAALRQYSPCLCQLLPSPESPLTVVDRDSAPSGIPPAVCPISTPRETENPAKTRQRPGKDKTTTRLRRARRRRRGSACEAEVSVDNRERRFQGRRAVDRDMGNIVVAPPNRAMIISGYRGQRISLGSAASRCFVSKRRTASRWRSSPSPSTQPKQKR